MTPSQILQNFQRAGIRLEIGTTPGKLAVTPANQLTEEERELLKTHKAAILALLAEGDTAAPQAAAVSHETPSAKLESGELESGGAPELFHAPRSTPPEFTITATPTPGSAASSNSFHSERSTPAEIGPVASPKSPSSPNTGSTGKSAAEVTPVTAKRGRKKKAPDERQPSLYDLPESGNSNLLAVEPFDTRGGELTIKRMVQPDTGDTAAQDTQHPMSGVEPVPVSSVQLAQDSAAERDLVTLAGQSDAAETILAQIMGIPMSGAAPSSSPVSGVQSASPSGGVTSVPPSLQYSPVTAPTPPLSPTSASTQNLASEVSTAQTSTVSVSRSLAATILDFFKPVPPITTTVSVASPPVTPTVQERHGVIQDFQVTPQIAWQQNQMLGQSGRCSCREYLRVTDERCQLFDLGFGCKTCGDFTRDMKARPGMPPLPDGSALPPTVSGVTIRSGELPDGLLDAVNTELDNAAKNHGITKSQLLEQQVDTLSVLYLARDSSEQGTFSKITAAATRRMFPKKGN